jgi:hypothetical protein
MKHLCLLASLVSGKCFTESKTHAGSSEGTKISDLNLLPPQYLKSQRSSAIKSCLSTKTNNLVGHQVAISTYDEFSYNTP